MSIIESGTEFKELFTFKNQKQRRNKKHWKKQYRTENFPVTREFRNQECFLIPSITWHVNICLSLLYWKFFDVFSHGDGWKRDGTSVQHLRSKATDDVLEARSVTERVTFRSYSLRVSFHSPHTQLREKRNYLWHEDLTGNGEGGGGGCNGWLQNFALSLLDTLEGCQYF